VLGLPYLSVKTACKIPILSGDTEGVTLHPRGLRYKYRVAVRGLVIGKAYSIQFNLQFLEWPK